MSQELSNKKAFSYQKIKIFMLPGVTTRIQQKILMFKERRKIRASVFTFLSKAFWRVFLILLGFELFAQNLLGHPVALSEAKKGENLSFYKA